MLLTVEAILAVKIARWPDRFGHDMQPERASVMEECIVARALYHDVRYFRLMVIIQDVMDIRGLPDVGTSHASS